MDHWGHGSSQHCGWMTSIPHGCLYFWSKRTVQLTDLGAGLTDSPEKGGSPDGSDLAKALNCSYPATACTVAAWLA